MKVNAVLAFALPAVTSAYPGMMGASSRAELENALKEAYKREAAAQPEPQGGLLTGVGDTVKALGDTVAGLLNSVGNALVVANNKRPEPGYTFQAPGPGDSRGPCPGLNLLANCESILLSCTRLQLCSFTIYRRLSAPQRLRQLRPGS